MTEEVQMAQDLRERVAVTERLVEGLINQMKVKNDKIDQIGTDLSSLANRYVLLESKFDTFSAHIDLKIETILTAQETFRSQFNEKQIIDKTQLKLEEQQRRRLMKILGALGTLFIACVSNLDKIEDFFTRNDTPVSEVAMTEPSELQPD